MKTKLLKRVRKHRTILWNNEIKYFVLLDHKKKKVYRYSTSRELTVQIAILFLGLNSYFNHLFKNKKRDERLKYFKALKDYC